MQNFGRENFDDSTCIRQIRPSKFYAIRYAVRIVSYVVTIILRDDSIVDGSKTFALVANYHKTQ